jgi:UDP-glucose 4-epimerase
MLFAWRALFIIDTGVREDVISSGGVMGSCIPIIVTGANGFVGRHIVKRLVRDGHKVSTITRSSDSNIDSISENFQLDLAMDIPNPDWLAGKEILIHLAGNTGGDDTDSLIEKSDNVRMAQNLATTAKEAGIAKIIIMSSVAATLANQTAGRSNRYGVEKAVSDEIFLEQLSADQKLLFLRPPAIYGSGMKGGIAPLFKLTAKGLPIPLGLASEPRPYLSVRNLADLVSHIVVANSKAWEKCDRKFIEVHDGELVATNTLIRYIAAAQGKKTRLLPFPTGVLRAVAKMLNKSDMLSGALDPVVIKQSALLQDCFNWVPVEKMPDSLKF